MLRTLLSAALIIFISYSTRAQKPDLQKIAESLNGEWLTVKWVSFEDMRKTFTAEEQNDRIFDSLNCVTARATITQDSIVFDRDKACSFKPCMQPFEASSMQRLAVISTTDLNQKRPGIELRVGSISRYFMRLLAQDGNGPSPLLISTGCEAGDNKDEHLSVIYFNDNNIALYSTKDVIVLKRNIIPPNPGEE